MDRRLDHRAVDAQLPSAGHLQLPGERHDMVQQAIQRRRPDQVGPAQQGRIVRCSLEPQPAELPQDQAVAHELLGLGVAPAVQPPRDQHPQQHLDRRRGPPGLPRARMPPSEVLAQRPEQDVVIEQGIQPSQHRLELERQRRYEGEQVDGWIPIT
jgi:hypothetical protein